MSWTPYVIRQGDHLDQLAERFCFDAATVWNDPRNRALRERRNDPAVLNPGDVLHLPKARPDGPRFAHHSGNAFTARLPSTRVKLSLREGDGALAGSRCKVALHGGEPFFVTSGPDGGVEFDVPVSTREVRVIVEERAVELVVDVGGLDPIEVASGVRQRLANLGYYPAAHDGDALAAARDDDHLAALRAFKRDHRLGGGDAVDDTLVEALRGAHGA